MPLCVLPSHGSDRLLPFLVALLFVVHPLHVEVVANIKGRDEILALFFGLASVVLLVKALESLSWSLLLAGTACFVAACLSKTNAVTLLPLVALVAWYRASNPRMSRRLVASMAAIGLCSLALVQLIRHLQSTVSTDTPLHLSSTVLNNIFLWTARPETIVPTALVIVARYAALFLFPHPLIHLYGHDQVPLNEWGDLSTWLVLAGLVLVGVALYRDMVRPAPAGLRHRLLRRHVLGLFQSSLLCAGHDGGSLHVHALDRVGPDRVCTACSNWPLSTFSRRP